MADLVLTSDATAAKRNERKKRWWMRPYFGGELRDCPLAELELDPRVKNALEKVGLLTVGEVMDTPDYQMLWIANFGRKSLAQVRDRIAQAAP